MIWGKKNLEFRRQAFHLLMGAVFGTLIYFEIVKWIFLSLLLLLLLLIASIHRKKPLSGFGWLLLQLERPKVLPGVGAIQMIFGMLITTLIFEPKIAGAAILILGFGDSVSTYVGKKYGAIKLAHNRTKSLEGSLSGFLAALLVASPAVGIEMAFIGSFIGMFFESFNDRMGLDDNLIVPVTAGIAMMLIAG